MEKCMIVKLRIDPETVHRLDRVTRLLAGNRSAVIRGLIDLAAKSLQPALAGENSKEEESK